MPPLTRSQKRAKHLKRANVLPLPAIGPWDLVFRGCDARTLTMLSASNRELRGLVKSYKTRSYKLYQFLSKFFTPEEFAVFRTVQATTGTLISGSTALQFFLLTEWPESDLDLYVEVAYSRRVVNFLLKCGYVYVPYSHQLPSLSDQQMFHQEIPYMAKGIADVMNFKKGGDTNGACIQIIMAWRSPLECILDFHSTVVMNLISAHNAVCLYPMETLFEKRAAVVTAETHSSKTKRALEKYTGRGWTMFNMDPQYFTKNRLNKGYYFYLDQLRWVGDEKCLVIPLDVAGDGIFSIPINPDPVLVNSWKMRYGVNGDNMKTTIHVHGEELKYQFLYSLCDPTLLWDIFWDVMDENEDNEDDLDLAFAMKVFTSRKELAAFDEAEREKREKRRLEVKRRLVQAQQLRTL